LRKKEAERYFFAPHAAMTSAVQYRQEAQRGAGFGAGRKNQRSCEAEC
jgi:hypothetical protein